MTGRGDVGGWSFEGRECTVKKHLLREEFRVTDPDGNTLLTTERKVAEGRATFPFQDSEGNAVFRVDSGQTFDIEGEYTLVKSETDEPELVLSRELDFRRHHWTIDRPDGERIAELSSRRGIAGALNTVVDVFSPFPRTFTVTAPNGEHVGTISGRLSPRTAYDVRIERPGAIPRTTLTAGAVAVAVLESV
ncbi:hypothetical protein BG842_18725 [Haladaptatus sp. W1]|uniref:hypothetical protein n=1 Tax=Haladaptatus sp. W1 TaxID=1897478 RepID=UPI000849B118|nr:hypothetical protein [Haladaptatus sp. W1]ODR82434.1 hypothetical protein BG842_18725 [Haladaptatus sp. W1]